MLLIVGHCWGHESFGGWVAVWLGIDQKGFRDLPPSWPLLKIREAGVMISEEGFRQGSEEAPVKIQSLYYVVKKFNIG